MLKNSTKKLLWNFSWFKDKPSSLSSSQENFEFQRFNLRSLCYKLVVIALGLYWISNTFILCSRARKGKRKLKWRDMARCVSNLMLCKRSTTSQGNQNHIALLIERVVSLPCKQTSVSHVISLKLASKSSKTKPNYTNSWGWTKQCNKCLW